jgi:LAO/AO transport system kinase
MGLLERAREGDQRALSRLCSLIETNNHAAIEALDALGDPPDDVQIVGISGPPGVGKSTLINLLLEKLRDVGQQIAVLLVDPSSAVSGGAVLGDRIRMLDRSGADVFVRSQASRGQLGGLAPSTATLIDLFAHAGFGRIIIETVGVGQDAIDIRSLCTTSVVVQSPNLGDSVQSLKAGILETADIFAVAKADIPGAHAVIRDLNSMLQLAHPPSEGWQIPVIAVSSKDKRGIAELARSIRLHGQSQSPVSRDSMREQRWRWETLKRAEASLAHATGRLDTRSVGVQATRSYRVKALLQAALAENERLDSRSRPP